MVAVPSTASLLPGVKCSNCGVEVQLSMMGEHMCSTSSPDSQNNATMDGRISRIASQTARSNSRRRGRLRVDSSAANKPFLRPNELTPASSATYPPANELYGKKPASGIVPKPGPRMDLPRSPPSPEYSNLDCAFPPFPSAGIRTSPALPKAGFPDAQLDNGYVREHAERYKPTRPVTPPSRDSRARPTGGPWTSRRSGFVGTLPAPVSQPSDGSRRTRPPLTSYASSPAVEQRPPPTPSKRFGHVGNRSGMNLDFGAHGRLQSEFSGGERLVDRPLPSRPISPNRSQTYPPHYESRFANDTLTTDASRRSSQPPPMSPSRESPDIPDNVSLRSLRGPRPPLPAKTPSYQNSPLQGQREPYLPQPPTDMHPNVDRSTPGNRPFPTHKANLSGMRVSPMTAALPPLPAQHAGGVSETEIALSAPLPDLALPAPQPAWAGAPESPTDPLYMQGQLSPLPRGAPKRPTFSTNRSSSASSIASSSTGHSLYPRRRHPGAHKGTCRGCSRAILAGEKSVSSKDGRLTGRYHKTCFACHTCGSPFQTADFYVHDDLPYCAPHYHAMNGSLCSGCGNGIEGQYLETITMKGRKVEKFHPQCLKCFACQTALQDDYYEWMGRCYCEQDARRVAHAQSHSPSPSSFSSPRPSPSPSTGSLSSSRSPSPLPRSGLPSGPRAGLMPQTPRAGGGMLGHSHNGSSFLAPLPTGGSGSQPPPPLPAGIRFPERRTTRLMMM